MSEKFKEAKPSDAIVISDNGCEERQRVNDHPGAAFAALRNEITTKEDVRAALEKVFEPPGLQKSAVKSMRKAYEGTQTAGISLAAEAAPK